MQRQFSPSRLLRRSDGLKPLSQGAAGSEWVLGRGFCAYTVLDCPALPAARRRAFVATAVRRWAPFPDPQYHVEWAGPRAMVWAWSAQAVRALPSEAALDPPRRLIPESLLVGAPGEDGTELLALEEGFEGRVWRQHALAASRWWPAVPELDEWNGFLRGAGLPAAERVPEAQRPPLRAQSWAGAMAGGWPELARRYRAVGLWAAAGVLALVFAAPIAGIARLAWAGARVQAQIAAQDQSLQAILSAREQAERDAAAVEALLALRPPAGQLDLLATVAGLLPAGARIMEWRMPNAQTLEVVLSQDRPDPRTLVQAWQGSGRFQEVGADLGRTPQEVTLRARILRAAPEAAE